MIHALAHIELNAIDLALDIVARFCGQPVPRSFFDGWMMVATDEARHFGLLSDRLEALGSRYGALPAHDGLWQAVEVTAHDLAARLAVVPLILEARGLDVTPSLLAKLNEVGDPQTAAILDIIYNDEKRQCGCRRQMVPLPLRTSADRSGSPVPRARARVLPRRGEGALQRSRESGGGSDADILSEPVAALAVSLARPSTTL